HTITGSQLESKQLLDFFSTGGQFETEYIRLDCTFCKDNTRYLPFTSLVSPKTAGTDRHIDEADKKLTDKNGQEHDSCKHFYGDIKPTLLCKEQPESYFIQLKSQHLT
uniref:Uncharacterized protein n=1 Tax=Glossina palpalis gambiensis TaxID=67801 RepID=A0A1B0AKX3_9MUSC